MVSTSSLLPVIGADLGSRRSTASASGAHEWISRSGEARGLAGGRHLFASDEERVAGLVGAPAGVDSPTR
jgi:hypothetical protein